MTCAFLFSICMTSLKSNTIGCSFILWKSALIELKIWFVTLVHVCLSKTDILLQKDILLQMNDFKAVFIYVWQTCYVFWSYSCILIIIKLRFRELEWFVQGLAFAYLWDEDRTHFSWYHHFTHHRRLGYDLVLCDILKIWTLKCLSAWCLGCVIVDSINNLFIILLFIHSFMFVEY